PPLPPPRAGRDRGDRRSPRRRLPAETGAAHPPGVLAGGGRRTAAVVARARDRRGDLAEAPPPRARLRPRPVVERARPGRRGADVEPVRGDRVLPGAPAARRRAGVVRRAERRGSRTAGSAAADRPGRDLRALLPVDPARLLPRVPPPPGPLAAPLGDVLHPRHAA